MSDPSQDLGALLLAVGRLEGRVGEIAHGQNEMRMKVDGIAEKIFTAPTRDDYDKLGNKMDAALARIDALEGVNDRSDGAKGLAARVLESKAFGVIVTALFSVVAALAALKGGLIK
jgi:hypothetical protein